MGKVSRRIKKLRCIEHRKERYNHAIQKVIDGDADPSYATLRLKKLKEVMGK